MRLSPIFSATRFVVGVPVSRTAIQGGNPTDHATSYIVKAMFMRGRPCSGCRGAFAGATNPSGELLLSRYEHSHSALLAFGHQLL